MISNNNTSNQLSLILYKLHEHFANIDDILASIIEFHTWMVVNKKPVKDHISSISSWIEEYANILKRTTILSRELNTIISTCPKQLDDNTYKVVSDVGGKINTYISAIEERKMAIRYLDKFVPVLFDDLPKLLEL